MKNVSSAHIKKVSRGVGYLAFAGIEASLGIIEEIIYMPFSYGNYYVDEKLSHSPESRRSFLNVIEDNFIRHWDNWVRYNYEEGMRQFRV